MKTRQTETQSTQALLENLEGKIDYDYALEQFKKFRHDLLEPQEYLYLLKRLQEGLLDLQADGLEDVIALEKRIENLAQDSD